MKKVIAWTAIVALGLLFVYASYYKLKDYPLFVSQLEESPILGKYGKLFSILVPSTELLIVLSFFFKRTRLIGLYAGFLFMLLLTVYVFVLPHFFTAPGCSCGGIIDRFSWRGHFWFNLGFTILAGIGLSLFPNEKKKMLYA